MLAKEGKGKGDDDGSKEDDGIYQVTSVVPLAVGKFTAFYMWQYRQTTKCYNDFIHQPLMLLCLRRLESAGPQLTHHDSHTQ
jgi:hypothetical protein